MSERFLAAYLQRDAEGPRFSALPANWENVSITDLWDAWAQWRHKQTMLINEKKLNMMNAEHRKLLERNGELPVRRQGTFISKVIRRKIKIGPLLRMRLRLFGL